MKRAIGNVIENIVEAMPNGGVLGVKVSKGKNEVAVSASDTGEGIPEPKRAMLFKPFYTTKPHGLGLGLFYAKDIVEAHGGSVSYASTPGKGTTFTISIPIVF